MDIYKLKSGELEGKNLENTLKNKKKIYHYFFGETYEEVLTKMKKIDNCNISDTIYNLSLTELYFEWLNCIKHNIKESTAENYKLKARLHILPAFGNEYILDITCKSINEFIIKKQADGLSNRYICDILTLLKSIFKYGVSTYGINDPMSGVIMPKKRQNEIRILNSEEEKALCVYLDKHHNNTSLGIKICYSTGLRIGELCALKGSNIDLGKRIITVNSTLQRICCTKSDTKTKLIITEPKSSASKRIIPISDALAEYLSGFNFCSKNYILSGTDTPVEPRTMQYRFAAILKSEKLPSIHFHALRHMFATNCIKAGFDVKTLSELLGHSSVEITLNRYVHSSFEQKKKYMNLLPI